MIIAFSPEQAHEFSQAFGAPWWLAESLQSDRTIEKDANDGKPIANTKRAAKKSTEHTKKACRGNANRCHPNNINHTTRVMFPPCRQYQQAAACRQRQAISNNNTAHVVPKKPPPSPSTRAIEHMTPIHMHKETPDAARMSLDVTGFVPQDVSIQVDNHIVHIQGRRTNKLGDVFVLDRKFRLDKKTSNVEGVSATFDNGILELTVPKKPVTKSRTIPIVVAGAATTTKPVAATTLEPEIHNEGDASEDKSSEIVKVETIVFSHSADAEEDPQSMEGANPEEKVEKDVISVETFQEDDSLIQEEEEEQNEIHDHEEDEKTFHTNNSTGNNAAGDDTWEEVLE